MNTRTVHPRRRRRRTMLGAVGLAVATVATTFAAAPASASPAPLVTEDGVGIRIDENAILGPALNAIEAELQPYVNDRIYQGALENSVMDNPDWVQGTADLDLSFDFIAAGTPGYPEGGLKVRGDLRNIMMRFYRYGAWWQPECQFRVNPADGWIEATAKIDTTKLPNAPLTINPIQAYWDNDPDITREKGNFLCTGYLLDEWWNGLWGNTTDVAAQLEAELDDVAQDLIDDVWDQYVTPVVNSLQGFGVTWGQVRTDDHGLIVTADVDATDLTIPGFGGPYDVSGALDSGANSDVNALLANRTSAGGASDVIVSVHPNVVNQFVNMVQQLSNNNIAAVAVPASIEGVLLDSSVHDQYADDGWLLTMRALAPMGVEPSGPGGAPMLGLPQIEMKFTNSARGRNTVATFTTSLANLALITAERPGSTDWGPTFSADGATLGTVTRTQADANAGVMPVPSSASLLPSAKIGFEDFNNGFFEQVLSLAPLELGPLDVDLCTTCGRYAGDQRYTETFHVS